MDDKHAVSIVAIMGLVFLEAVCILKDVDGAFFLPIVAAISGLAGYQFSAARAKKNYLSR